MGWHHGVLLNFFQDERYFIDIDPRLGDRNVDDPTVLQEMAKAGIIDKRIGFFFRPLGIPNRGNNDVTWGGIDEDFEGKLTYTCVLQCH